MHKHVQTLETCMYSINMYKVTNMYKQLYKHVQTIQTYTNITKMQENQARPLNEGILLQTLHEDSVLKNLFQIVGQCVAILLKYLI